MKRFLSFLMPVILVLGFVGSVSAQPMNEPAAQPPPPADTPSSPTLSAATSPTAGPANALPEAVLYFWDFEGNNGGFASTLDWEWGTYAWNGATCDAYTNYPPPGAYSGTQMWGTVLNSCYVNRGNNQGYATCTNTGPADDSILSFTIDLTGVSEAELSWWEWYDLFSNWDWAEVYANGSQVFPHCEASFVAPTAWVQQVVNLTPYVGGPVTIEFHMMASTVVNHAGWYIDDVMVTGDIPAAIDAWKEAPAFAEPGEVIHYTVVVSTTELVDGMAMTDTLPAGVEFAGNLAWSDGYAWYDSLDNAVYWEYQTPRAAGAPAAPRPIVYDPASATERAGGAELAAPPPEGPVTLWAYPEAVFWDNGPLVTHPGDCAGGDASRLQTGLGMSLFGFGHQFSIGNRMADDFTIADPGGLQIDTITFFAYQTGAPTSPSPITGVYVQIWDGPPDDPGSSIVFGDLVTNRLLSSTFTNIQRDSETSPCANTRYIFADVASAEMTLPPGTYWLDWMTDGSASYTGPWAPPITILGQTTTGNALQYTTSSGAWAPALDTGTSTQQDMPFIIEGAIGAGEQVTISFDATVTAACGDVIVNEGVVSLGGTTVRFSAATHVSGDPDIAVTPPTLEAELYPDTTTVGWLEICNVGDCPLHWQIYEIPSFLGFAGSPSVQPATLGVLWDQPLSTVNQGAYVDQDFPDSPSYSSFLADDFTNADTWLVEDIFVPGGGWNGFTTLMDATALTWQIYADCAGIPCGDPAGGGDPPVWMLTRPPDHPLVTITPGTPGGMPSDVLLHLPMPLVLPPGTWWLVFYPTMEFAAFGQYGRQPADTTNGYTGQFINPGGGFGLGTAWQSWAVVGPTQQDIAFRVEGASVPIGDVPWLSENPIVGTVPAGDCQMVAASFDAGGLLPGDYFASLLIVNDDPDTPQMVVPVTMTVLGYPVYLPVILRQSP